MNLTPLNLGEEKKKFLFDTNYNPQFIYEKDITAEFLYDQYGRFDGELSQKALWIVESVLKKWGSESEYLNAVEGKILSREDATKRIQEYLQDCGLQSTVKLNFSDKFIARTHIHKYMMNIRLPIDYREKGIIGMLHHEIGTHVYRRINDEKQPWLGKRKEYAMGSYLETEEGLAVLHYYLELDTPYMWIYAIQYYACFLANKFSFAEVFSKLKPYIDDRERRFKIALRAKRGLADTSQPGGYTKDQVYLRGLVKVSKWLRENDFMLEELYLGKVSVEDLDRIRNISKHTGIIIPKFYMQNPTEYKKKVILILKTNAFYESV